MNLHSQAKSTWGILIACAFSGLSSGEIVNSDVFSFSSGFGWRLLFGPGIVFGLLFSITSAYLWNKSHKIFRFIAFVFLFTIASTFIYFIAVQIAIRIMFLSNSDSNGFVAGGLAGLFGAGALSRTAKILSQTRINFPDEILTTILGTLAGSIFFVGFESSTERVNWSLQFVIWQVVVGWSLNRSIQKGITLATNLNPGNNSVSAPGQSASEL